MINRSSKFSPGMRGALNDVLGGGAASVLTITFGLSYALLIFAGPLSPYLSYGLAATFIASTVLATILALGSSLPFAIAAPDSSTAAVSRDPDVVAGRANDGNRSLGAAAGAGPDHARPFDDRDGNRALRLRHHPHGPGHPLRALSRGRRLSRRHRPLDRSRCDQGHHRTSPAIRHARPVRQSDDLVGAGRGLRDGAGALSDLAPFAHFLWFAGHPGRWRDRGPSCVLARRHFARRGAGGGLDLSAAAIDHLHAAMASRRARRLSVAPACRISRAT